MQPRIDRILDLLGLQIVDTEFPLLLCGQWPWPLVREVVDFLPQADVPAERASVARSWSGGLQKKALLLDFRGENAFGGGW